MRQEIKPYNWAALQGDHRVTTYDPDTHSIINTDTKPAGSNRLTARPIGDVNNPEAIAQVCVVLPLKCPVVNLNNSTVQAVGPLTLTVAAYANESIYEEVRVLTDQHGVPLSERTANQHGITEERLEITEMRRDIGWTGSEYQSRAGTVWCSAQTAVGQPPQAMPSKNYSQPVGAELQSVYAPQPAFRALQERGGDFKAKPWFQAALQTLSMPIDVISRDKEKFAKAVEQVARAAIRQSRIEEAMSDRSQPASIRQFTNTIRQDPPRGGISEVWHQANVWLGDVFHPESKGPLVWLGDGIRRDCAKALTLTLQATLGEDWQKIDPLVLLRLRNVAFDELIERDRPNRLKSNERELLRRDLLMYWMMEDGALRERITTAYNTDRMALLKDIRDLNIGTYLTREFLLDEGLIAYTDDDNRRREMLDDVRALQQLHAAPYFTYRAWDDLVKSNIINEDRVAYWHQRLQEGDIGLLASEARRSTVEEVPPRRIVERQLRMVHNFLRAYNGCFGDPKDVIIADKFFPHISVETISATLSGGRIAPANVHNMLYLLYFDIQDMQFPRDTLAGLAQELIKYADIHKPQVVDEVQKIRYVEPALQRLNAMQSQLDILIHTDQADDLIYALFGRIIEDFGHFASKHSFGVRSQNF